MSRKKVMLVGQEGQVDKELIRSLSSSSDYEVCGIADYKTAFQLENSSQPDVIVFERSESSQSAKAVVDAKKLRQNPSCVNPDSEMGLCELERRIELEQINNRLAADLLVVDGKAFSKTLEAGLSQLAEFLGLKGLTVRQCPEPNKKPRGETVYFSSLDPEKIGLFCSMSAADEAWIFNRMKGDGTFVVSSLDDLPSDRQEMTASLTKSGIEAFVVLQLDSPDSVITFFSGKKRSWRKQELIGLQSVAGVVANALVRQRIEAERQQLQEQLMQAQKLEAIGKLTGGIAHDFNNMLVPIIGYADSILEECQDLEWFEEVSEIRKAASTAASLTRQLLAFSRKQILVKQPLALNDEIGAMNKLLTRMMGEDVLLDLHFLADRQIIEADKGQIQQIIMNLCVNARDAMPEGGTILISTENDPENAGKLILRVRDTGIGMSESVRKRVFDPFFSTKGENGTGLGLSVVYEIIRQHKGEVELISEEGVGTEFIIRFPARVDTDEAIANRGGGVRGERVCRGRGKRILLVEDEPAVIAFVKKALSKKGFEVVAAENRKQAIHIFDENDGNYDLIFTDAKLPDGTGIDVLAHIFERNPQMRAIISSGYTDNRALLEQADQMGVTFLQKPYPLTDLFNTINQVMDNSAQREEDVVLPA